MGKPDGLSRRSEEEKSGMEVKSFDEGQSTVLGEDENEKEGEVEDMELEGIDVAGGEKREGLWVVPEEH